LPHRRNVHDHAVRVLWGAERRWRLVLRTVPGRFMHGERRAMLRPLRGGLFLHYDAIGQLLVSERGRRIVLQRVLPWVLLRQRRALLFLQRFGRPVLHVRDEPGRMGKLRASGARRGLVLQPLRGRLVRGKRRALLFLQRW
jgi:hypothetical protein